VRERKLRVGRGYKKEEREGYEIKKEDEQEDGDKRNT
jgi:hypothetical protein